MKRALLQGVVGLAVAASAGGVAQEPAQAVEIHIDQHCRVVTQSQQDPTQLEFEEAPQMCHLEGRHDTQRMRPDGRGGQVSVSIHEQIYFLTDTLDQPVTFVVAQFVPEGWRIDSDPQPDAMEGATALFRVTVEPGQTEQLHVGVRHPA